MRVRIARVSRCDGTGGGRPRADAGGARRSGALCRRRCRGAPCVHRVGGRRSWPFRPYDDAPSGAGHCAACGGTRPSRRTAGSPCRCAALRATARRGVGAGRPCRLRSPVLGGAVRQERDLDGILLVEAESFTNPWTRAMYAWELQNPAVCHIYVVRTPECRVAGSARSGWWWTRFTSTTWRSVPAFRGQGFGTRADAAVLTEGRRLGATRATLEVRASNEPARASTSAGIRGGRARPALLHESG